MFKKLKQKIEEEDKQTYPNTHQKHHKNIVSSTPKKISSSSRSANNSSRINGESNLRKENKWERRRISSASLYSSRESLLSVDSSATATFSKASFNDSSSNLGTPVDCPVILGTFRDAASKDEMVSELTKKSNHIKKLENKINEMADAFMDQKRERDRLEEALENIRNEMHNRIESSKNDNTRRLKEGYEERLAEKDKQLKEYIHRNEQDSARFTDVKELNMLQQDEVAKMKAMLIHSQTEMSKKAAELVEKTKQIENLDKSYSEQKLELEGLQDRLNDLSKDRSRFESQEKDTSGKILTLQKEKSALKSQLSDLINELTQKSSELESARLTVDRSHEEILSLRQTYNLYKTKTSSDIDELRSEKAVLKERLSDLEQRLEDGKLSENGQFKAVEKERSLLEKRLEEIRKQMNDFKTHSNDQISTLGSLVATLNEQVKEKTGCLENLQRSQEGQNKRYEAKIADLESQLSKAERSCLSIQNDTATINSLQNKLKEQEQRVSSLKTEKMELEILADRASFIEAQNKLLDTRFKETVDRLEKDRSGLEEKLRESQSELRKSSFRQEHTSKRKTEQLETKVEDQERKIEHYQQRLEELVEEKDSLTSDLQLKDDECKQLTSCLEDALTQTNELKNEISNLETSLHEKNSIITYIKESSEISPANNSMDSLLREELTSLRETFSNREQALVERDGEIDELRTVLEERDNELATVSMKLREFQENNKFGRGKNSDKDLQKTVARLTAKIQELESQSNHLDTTDEYEIEKRSLQAELEESQQKVRNLQQYVFDLKKQFQVNNKKCEEIDTSKESNEDRDYLDVNFKYLKHVILKYMCSTNEQSRQLVGVIGHLLHFSQRESAIVKDCFDWKLPLEK